MEQLYSKIEKNKRHRQKLKEKKLLQREKIKETVRERADKRSKKEIKSFLTDTHDEFLDKNLLEPKPDLKEQLSESTTTPAVHFTVLGNDNFEKKEKVFIHFCQLKENVFFMQTFR